MDTVAKVMIGGGALCIPLGLWVRNGAGNSPATLSDLRADELRHQGNMVMVGGLGIVILGIILIKEGIRGRLRRVFGGGVAT